MKHLFTTLSLLVYCLFAFGQVPTTFDAKEKKASPASAQPSTFSFEAIPQPATPSPQRLFAPIHGSQLGVKNQHQSELHKVTRSPENGQPIFIKGQRTDATDNSLQNERAVESATFQYLDDISSALNARDPQQEWNITQMERDDLGMTHVELQQTYQGVPVWGGEAQVHFEQGGGALYNGHYRANIQLKDVVPTLSNQMAIDEAIRDVKQHTLFAPPLLPGGNGFLAKYGSSKAELVIFAPVSPVATRYLAWHVTIFPNSLERFEYFIDAHTGDVLDQYNHTCTVGPTTGSGQDLNGQQRSVGVFDLGSQYILLDASKSMYKGPTNASPKAGDGYLITLDWQNNSFNNQAFREITSSNNTWDRTAISAHYNASEAFDYFESTFSRNSINGQGGDVVSFINVADENGAGFDNAFWNGSAIFYGNGNRAFTPLAGGLDVAGHEMSHGVIQETANLEYKDQSGALNESFADIFGAMIDRDDWQIGEDVVQRSAFPSGTMRDMADPHNGGSSLNDPGFQPERMSEIYTGTADNGGVHINSGIPNRAYYLYATAIGKNKAEQVYYRALTRYLNKSSQFIDCRLAVVQAATDLHGANSNEVNEAKSAFDAVEIFNGNGTSTQNNIPPNPGADFIVVSGVNTPAAIYMGQVGVGNLEPLSNTPHKRRISVTDDGQNGIFVGQDSDVRVVNMDPNNPQEGNVTTDRFWDNAAVSKDGNRIAFISTQVDTSIYVYDFVSQRGGKYRLYNPTFTQGVNSGGVLYADAIQWDLSGEYILYDAFNRIRNLNGQDIDYWDMGIIRVWDKQRNNFGDGQVELVFTNLPEGVNIGNGVFSKNSPFIITFDYFNSLTNEYGVLAANLQTGDVGTVYQQRQLGVPDYSAQDDKIVFSAVDNFGAPVVAVIDLEANKIQGRPNTAQVFVNSAQWPHWYANGPRVINVSNEPSLQEGLVLVQVYPNPTTGTFAISYHLDKASLVKIELKNVMGETIATPVEKGNQVAGGHRFDVSALKNQPAGTYFLLIHANGKVVSKKIARF
ncbi:MAG: M4 family metallopeptidase [Bacteroidota bacterium]